MYNRFKKRERVDTDIKPNKVYTKAEMEEIADQILRDDSKTEMCRQCEQKGKPTGLVEPRPQENTTTRVMS
jgi:hypothetical protein